MRYTSSEILRKPEVERLISLALRERAELATQASSRKASANHPRATSPEAQARAAGRAGSPMRAGSSNVPPQRPGRAYDESGMPWAQRVPVGMVPPLRGGPFSAALLSMGGVPVGGLTMGGVPIGGAACTGPPHDVSDASTAS